MALLSETYSSPFTSLFNPQMTVDTMVYNDVNVNDFRAETPSPPPSKVIVKTKAIPRTINLTKDKEIPLLGLGTWKSKPNEVYEAVKYAILEAGYRHIDCAFAYQNEHEVGRALKEILESGRVKREELFITTKCWNVFHSTHLVKESLRRSLADLQLDYVDLFLIHWPFGYQEGGSDFPRDENGVSIKSDVDYIDTWKGMEECVALGWTKTIGLSNFNSEQITRVLSMAKIKPVCNQVECSPYLTQEKLIQFCREKEIVVVAYSPLGQGNNELLKEPIIQDIAWKYSKTPAQVILRWMIQRNVPVIPKSVTPSRINSNNDIWDFELTSLEMDLIGLLNRGLRFTTIDHAKNHKYYPFNAPF